MYKEVYFSQKHLAFL